MTEELLDTYFPQLDRESRDKLLTIDDSELRNRIRLLCQIIYGSETNPDFTSRLMSSVSEMVEERFAGTLQNVLISNRFSVQDVNDNSQFFAAAIRKDKYLTWLLLNGVESLPKKDFLKRYGQNSFTGINLT